MLINEDFKEFIKDAFEGYGFEVSFDKVKPAHGRFDIVPNDYLAFTNRFIPSIDTSYILLMIKQGIYLKLFGYWDRGNKCFKVFNWYFAKESFDVEEREHAEVTAKVTKDVSVVKSWIG